MKSGRSWVGVGVAAMVIATPRLIGLPSARADAASPQQTESKQASQADVEAQLGRMLAELKRENARRAGPTGRDDVPKVEPVDAPREPLSRVIEPPWVPAPVPQPVAAIVSPSAVRTPLPAIEGFIAADVQAFLGVPSTAQQGPGGTTIWHYLTPSGRQFVYFVSGIATVTPPPVGPPNAPVAAPPRQAPGVQAACDGVSATAGVKNVAVLNPESPVFIEPKFRTQALTTLPVRKTGEVVSAEGAWYLIRFNDERWGRRVGYIHCSDVIRQDK